MVFRKQHRRLMMSDQRPIRLTPIDIATERLLIVHSVNATSQAERESVKQAVRDFHLAGQTVSVTADEFGIPQSARPGVTLSSELIERLNACVGAIVFIDDLRPNITYELGYMHGRGRSVLLLSRRPIENSWIDLSDLAGVAIADLNRQDINDAVCGYLQRLYEHELRNVQHVHFFRVPTAEDNLLGRSSTQEGLSQNAGPFGAMLSMNRYEPPISVAVGKNLSPTARVLVILRAPDRTEHYSIYFRVRYADLNRDPARIFLGVTSHRRDAWITRGERQFPSQTLQPDWRMLALSLSDLLRRGAVLGTGDPDYLEEVWFRVGHRGQERIGTVEVAYLGISGIDE
jgi:hypothetical protein